MAARQNTGIAPSLTRNQIAVFEALRTVETPLTAYQILDLEAIRAAGLKAPLTVYRALDRLMELGHVHRIESLNAFVACEHEPHSTPSVFMICARCRKTTEVAADNLTSAAASLAEAQDFEVETVSIEITGRCAACGD